MKCVDPDDDSVDNTDKNLVPVVPVWIVVVSIYCFVIVNFFLYLSWNKIDWKNFSYKPAIEQKSLRSCNHNIIEIYKGAFADGVDCGIDAFIFFANRGDKELDKQQVYKKAIEIQQEKVFKQVQESKK